MTTTDPHWLAEALKLPGRSQADLARRLKVDPSAVNRIVKGQREIKAREMIVIEDYLRETTSDPEPGGWYGEIDRSKVWPKLKAGPGARSADQARAVEEGDLGYSLLLAAANLKRSLQSAVAHKLGVESYDHQRQLFDPSGPFYTLQALSKVALSTGLVTGATAGVIAAIGEAAVAPWSDPSSPDARPAAGPELDAIFQRIVGDVYDPKADDAVKAALVAFVSAHIVATLEFGAEGMRDLMDEATERMKRMAVGEDHKD